MRIFILSLGTQGDFELFRILGTELHGRGHQVVLGTSEFYAARARSAGLDCTQIGAGTLEELRAVLQSLAPVSDRKMRTWLFAQNWLRLQVGPYYDQIQSLAEGSDFFISNLNMILHRAGRVIPGAFVTYDPPMELEDLKKIDRGPYQGRILDLVAMNKKLVDSRDMWGLDYHFTGFWKDSQPPNWDPPAQLLAFLENGPPPVVLTMGSMVTYDANELVSAAVRAIQQAGQRGMVVGAWSGITDLELAAGQGYGIKEAPYDWLFPRAACVIHHGGCGTVAAVLRAGVPSILLPQVTCQERFGWLLGQAGLITGMFDSSALDTETLAGAIRTAVADPQFRQNAVKWRDVIARDPGVTGAADLIEAHWRQAAG
jgi:UDP:flavonoid glycosyltransferase YjiC (YdhE family)